MTKSAAYKTELELQNFTAETFKKHFVGIEESVSKALVSKNNIINEFQNRNRKLSEKLKDCKELLENKDTLIKQLEHEKEDFKTVTLTEVEKFDSIYQKKIDELENEKHNLNLTIVKQKDIIDNHEHFLLKSKPKLKDNSKNGKLLKKYKDLKITLKSKDLELMRKEEERKNLWMYIEAKVEKFKTKEIEILDLRGDINKATAKANDLEEEVNKKNLEVGELKSKLAESINNVNLLKNENNILNEEVKKLKSDMKVKDDLLTEKDISIQEIQHKLGAEQANILSLHSLNNFMEEELKIKEKEMKEIKATNFQNDEANNLIKKEIEELSDENKHLKRQFAAKIEELGAYKKQHLEVREGLEKNLTEKDEEIKQIQGKVFKLTNDVELLKQQNTTLSDKSNDLKVQLGNKVKELVQNSQEFEKSLAEKEETILEITEKLLNGEEAVQSSRREKEKMTYKFTSLENELELKVEELKESKRVHAESKLEFERLVEAKDLEVKQIIGEVEQEKEALNSVKKEKQELLSKLNDLENKFGVQAEELTELKREQEERILEFERSLEEKDLKIKTAMDELHKVKGDFESLEKEEETLNGAYNNLENQLVTKAEELVEAKKVEEEMRIGFEKSIREKDRKIEVMIEKNEDAAKATELLSKQIATLKDEHKNLEIQFDKKAEELVENTALQMKVAEGFEKTVVEKDEEIKNLETKIAELMTSEKIQEEMTQVFEKCIKEKDESIKEMNRKLQYDEGAFEMLKKQRESLNDKFKDLQIQLTSKDNELLEAKRVIKEMKETLRKHTENIVQDSKETIKAKDIEIRNLRFDLKIEKASNEKVISEMKKQRQGSNGELEKLKVEIETKEEELTLKEFVMQDTVEKKDIEIKDLNIKLDKNEDALILLEKQSDQLKEEVRSLKSDLDIKDNLIKIKTVEEQAKSLSIQRFNTRNDLINEELRLRDKEMKEMKSKIDKDEETINVLKRKAETIEDKYKEMARSHFDRYKALATKYEKLKTISSVKSENRG